MMISVMYELSIVFIRDKVINMGAIFCHVISISPIIQLRLDITVGNHQ